jgi:hypothetical protein
VARLPAVLLHLHFDRFDKPAPKHWPSDVFSRANQKASGFRSRNTSHVSCSPEPTRGDESGKQNPADRFRAPR